MTLKEIEKIIDESNFVITKGKLFGKEFYPLHDQEEKNIEKFMIDVDIKRGIIYFFYRLDEETGEMTLLAKVDHVDKEKKVIKKRLDEMTQEETLQVKDKLCKGGEICAGCPLFDKGAVACLVDFPFWKKLYEDNKDKKFEIEIEVEE